MLVSRCLECGKSGRGVVAPTKRDGVGSSRVGVADHGERSVLRSMLGLGTTSNRFPRSVLSQMIEPGCSKKKSPNPEIFSPDPTAKSHSQPCSGTSAAMIIHANAQNK